MLRAFIIECLLATVQSNIKSKLQSNTNAPGPILFSDTLVWVQDLKSTSLYDYSGTSKCQHSREAIYRPQKPID